MPEQIKSIPRVPYSKMASDPELEIAVGEKGGIVVKGLQRFPTTLYMEQWERLSKVMDEILLYGVEHESDLSDGRPGKVEKEKPESLITLDAPYAAILDAEIVARTAANDVPGAVKYATIKAVAERNRGKLPVSDMLEVYTLKARK